MIPVTESFGVCPSWLLEPSAELTTLWRPSDGERIELEDVSRPELDTFLSALRSARYASEIWTLLQPFGEDADALFELLREQRVLVEPLRAAPQVRQVWFESVLQGNAEVVADDAHRFAAVLDSVVYWQSGCEECLALRTLGVLGEPGSEQTRDLGSVLDPAWVDALLAAACLDVSRCPLQPGEAILVRLERGAERGRVAPHADCRRCGSTLAARDSLAVLRSELARDSAPPAEAVGIAAQFGDSPFAPVWMGEVEGPSGTFPFDLPFLTGNTRLTRRVGARLFCTSITAIAHGSAPSYEDSRLLAWSEGVERTLAQSVTEDVRSPSDDDAVYSVYRRHGRAAVPCCQAWDLLHERSWLVPQALVAVATPDVDGSVLEPTFTGASSHTSYLAGILHATAEVLKRDAFLIAWYRKRCLRQLRWPSALPASADARARYLIAHGLELDAFDLRTDIALPMVLLRLRATRRVGNWPAGGIQLFPAGGFTPLEALSHALGLACTRFAGLGLDAAPEKSPLDERAVTELARSIPAWPAMVRYLNPARSGELDWLFSPDHADFADLGAELPTTPAERFTRLADSLRTSGLGWLCVPLTTADARAAGLRVVKVMVPEAVRFVLTPEEVSRTHPRLTRPWANAEPGSFNSLPHPLY